MRTHAWADLVGAVIAERYRLHVLVYSGRRQAEFLAVPANVEKTSEAFSVTLFEGEQAEIEQELSRVSEAKQLQHPNLLSILDGGSCSVWGDPFLYIVTEAIDGTLAQRLADGPLPHPEIRVLLDDLLAALAYIHAQGLVYRNLRPETIVRRGNRWKLGDLGDLHPAGRFPPSDTASPAGSPHAPPEAPSGSILPAWDIWTLGFTLQDALGGISGVAALPPPLADVVHGCFQPDPGKRLTLSDIQRILQPAEMPAQLTAQPAKAPPEPAHAIPRWAMVSLAVVVVCSLLWISARWRARQSAPPQASRTSRQMVPVAPLGRAAAARTGRPSPFPGRVAESGGASVAIPTAQPAGPPAAPAESAGQRSEVGQADYLSDKMEGRPTASGEPFNSASMNAAHRELPLGTRVRVTNLENQRSVIVRVNDRGAFRPGVIISVTRSAAEQLGFLQAGAARVSIQVVQ